MPNPSTTLSARLCLLALLAAGCGKPAAKADDPTKEPTVAPLVRALPTEIRQVRREIKTTGFLESEHQAQIVSLVQGRVRAIHADQGDLVKKGQLLAEIDDREATSALQQLSVQRDAKELDRQLAELEVEAADGRVSQAAIEQQKAKAEYDRQSKTLPEFVAPKALQDAELAYQSAQQAVDVARFNASKARLEVQRIASSVQELNARIDELKVRLENHRVVAPFDGVVTARRLSAGATVNAAAPMFEMVDPDRLVAWLDRPQSELELARKSKSVAFVCDAIPGAEFTADVDLVSPTVDRATGHFRLRMRVRPGDARTLVHGMFVRARILAEDLRPALMAPKAAMLSEGDVAVVMAVRGGKACRVDLDPGLEADEWIECKNTGPGGLQPGELVVVEGHEDLQDQAAVRVQQ